MTEEKFAPFRFMRPVCLICTISALLLGVAQALVMFMYYDPETVMYKQGAELALGVLYALYLAVIIATVVFCIIFRKRGYSLSPSLTYREGEKTRIELSIVRWLGGATFAVSAVMRAVVYVIGGSSFGLPEPAVWVMLICFCLMSLYFFPELDKALGVKNLSVFCGILGAVALVLDALAAYVDMNIPISADYRIITVACTLFFLFFILSEIRMKISVPKPWTYLACLCISGSFCGANFIGRTVFGLGLAPALTDNGCRIVCGLGLTIYVLSRLADPRIEAVDEEDEQEDTDDGMSEEITSEENTEDTEDTAVSADIAEDSDVAAPSEEISENG